MATFDGLTQPSTLKPSPSPTLRLAEAETRTKLLRPFRLNPCPTRPAPKLAPLTNVPSFAPASSRALPSPCHQLTNPDGGVRQGGTGMTLKTAFELVTVATALETITE